MPAKPSFFIVGAPKCGTTALYEYLRPHPHIFMPEIKEPHFFATDLGTYPRIKTLADYLDLFSAATSAHQQLGEASVYYLRSSVAIPGIREFNPEAKLIAMFRNPVDMVYSLHSQLLHVSEETVVDFETAWRLQERRARGLDLPARIRSPLLVQYFQIGQFGTQVQRMLSCFPREQVKLILYDDFATSPQRIYQEVIAFLEVPQDGRTEFPRINENKAARLPWLRRFYRKPPSPLRAAVRSLKRAVGGETISAAKKKLVALNTVRERRPPLDPALRARLTEAFREEVEMLGRLMNRDLSHWS